MTRDDSSHLALSAFHWGTYRVKVEDDRVSGLIPFEHDEDPSPIGHGITDVIDGPTRITAPMIRKSWLKMARVRTPTDVVLNHSSRCRGKQQNVLLPKNSHEFALNMETNRSTADHMDGRAPGDFIMRRVTYTAS